MKQLGISGKAFRILPIRTRYAEAKPHVGGRYGSSRDRAPMPSDVTPLSRLASLRRIDIGLNTA